MAALDNFSSNYDVALAELDRISGNILHTRKMTGHDEKLSNSVVNSMTINSANKQSSTYERIVSPLASADATPVKASAVSPPSHGWFSMNDSVGLTHSQLKHRSAEKRIQRELYQSPHKVSRSPPVVSQIIKSPESALREFSDVQSPTSIGIITAFRDLQSRARTIEQDRAAAVQERDQLKHLVLEKKRNEAMWRSKTDIESTEKLLEERSRGQLLRSAHEDVEAQINVREDVFRSLQKGMFAQTQRAAGLEREISTIVEANNAQERGNDSKMNAIGDVERKCEEYCRQIKYLKDSARGEFVSSSEFQGTEVMNDMKYLQVTAVELEKELLKQRKAQVRVDVRVRSLQKYMELILQINDDLTQMLTQKAHNEAQILDIADGFASKQRSTLKSGRHFSASPERVIPTYDEILHVIREESKGGSSPKHSSRSPTKAMRSRSPSRQKKVMRTVSHERESVTDSDCSAASSIVSETAGGTMKSSGSLRKASGAKGSKLLYNVERSHRAHNNSGRIPVDRNRAHHPKSVVNYGVKVSARATRQKISYAARNPGNDASYLKPTVTALYSQHRSVWEDSSESVPDGDVLLQRNSFIPSSLHPRKVELNSVAMESKTNKAVKELNATIASRYVCVYFAELVCSFDQPQQLMS